MCVSKLHMTSLSSRSALLEQEQCCSQLDGVIGGRGGVGQEVEQSSTDWKIGGSIPIPVEVSWGKILNPKLLLKVKRGVCVTGYRSLTLHVNVCVTSVVKRFDGSAILIVQFEPYAMT